MILLRLYYVLSYGDLVSYTEPIFGLDALASVPNELLALI